MGSVYVCALSLRCCVFSLCVFWRSFVLRFRLFFFTVAKTSGSGSVYAAGSVLTASAANEVTVEGAGTSGEGPASPFTRATTARRGAGCVGAPR